ncbi:hypothetical protein [Piscibacillus halophilus]|uniref:hypothetical protein n=1 Tax=Piscibacillus halophilus TaxID=571933 RepID=UPI00240A6776|nr:hypothetical protein [Piscibacillus halophilus]
MDDIENFLQRQWSALFQQLLYEQRTKSIEEKRMDYLSNQIADIKTAIMTSISGSDLENTAKGAIKYRRLLEVIYSLSFRKFDYLKQDINWEELLNKLNIVDILDSEKIDIVNKRPNKSIILLEDGTFFELRFPKSIFNEFEFQWESFRSLNDDSKNAIINAVLDDGHFPRFSVRYVNKHIEDIQQNFYDLEND